jgi:hypothetical protein
LQLLWVLQCVDESGVFDKGEEEERDSGQLIGSRVQVRRMGGKLSLFLVELEVAERPNRI